MFPRFLKAKRRRIHKTMVFIDYEYWYYAYTKQFHIKPSLSYFIEMLKQRDDIQIVDIMVFADFSNKSLSDELPKLRMVTNTIIETGNTYFGIKKDLTDFVMLDYIYQSSFMQKDIDFYILFTGDGHFQSVVKYLTQRRSLYVLIYAVQGSLSKQLQAVATESVELPTNEEILDRCRKMIIENMEYVSTKSFIVPTFLSTVDAISRNYDIPSEFVNAALKSMIDEGYIVQKMYRVQFNKEVRIVAANWDKLREAGLYPL